MMSSAERHKMILDLLNETDYVSNTDLIEKLNVSRETIRRDLNTLSDQGLLAKTHGGATSVERGIHMFDTAYDERIIENTDAKKKLCRSAAELVRDQDSIFLDNSSTVSFLIQYIPKHYHLTLITYSIRLLMEAAKLQNPNWKLVCLGGDFNPSTYCTGNYLAVDNLKKFHPTRCFISCHGIDSSLQVSDGYIGNVEIKSTLLNLGSPVYILVDASKLGRNGMISVAPAAEFHHIITNADANPEFVKRLQDAGCDVQIIS